VYSIEERETKTFTPTGIYIMAYSSLEIKRGSYGLEDLKDRVSQRLRDGFTIASIDHCRLTGNRSDYMTSTEIRWENDPIAWSIISESGNGDNLLGIIRCVYLDAFTYEVGETAYRSIPCSNSDVTRVKDVKCHHGNRDGLECFTVN
jgi:hypothetical protein